MEAFFCRIVTLGEPLPRFAGVRCRRQDLADTVADQLEAWEPFDVLEVRDEENVLILAVVGDTVAFSN